MSAPPAPVGPACSATVPRIGMLVARALIAFIFLYEGWIKLVSYSLAEAYMRQFSLPPLLLPGAIALELLAGLAILTGFGVRYAALALSAFCIVTAVVFHGRLIVTNELLHFQKDLAIAGGLLALAITDWQQNRARGDG